MVQETEPGTEEEFLEAEQSWKGKTSPPSGEQQQKVLKQENAIYQKKTQQHSITITPVDSPKRHWYKQRQTIKQTIRHTDRQETKQGRNAD